MIYFVLASLVYSWIALDLVQNEAPMTFRESLGAAVLCAVIAALWPPVLIWRLLLGPASNGRSLNTLESEEARIGARFGRHQTSA